MYVKKTEKQIKEVEVTTESYSLCDKCNEKIQTGIYDAFEFELEYKTGASYPESGSGDLEFTGKPYKKTRRFTFFQQVGNNYPITVYNS